MKYIIGGIVLVSLCVGGYFFIHKKPTPKPIAKHPYDFSGPCPGEVKTEKMNDNLMNGVIAEGENYKLITNYYWCNPVKNGDLVLLRFSQAFEPVVRRVYAIPGDEFKVYFNKSQGSWNVDVNDEVVTIRKAPYFFGAGDSKLPPPLKLLEVSRQGTLLDREIIIFSETPPGIRDSGTLGVVNLNDVVGKVEVIKK